MLNKYSVTVLIYFVHLINARNMEHVSPIPSLGLSAVWILTKKLFQRSEASKITHSPFQLNVEHK